jgi:ribosomal protein S18 acetylase RimI-like enzyme
MGNQAEKLRSKGMELVDSSGITWQEYKAFRLAALQNDPQAFASSFAREVAFPDQKWQERLAQAREKKTSWVLLAREQNSGKYTGMVGGFRNEDHIAQGTAEIWGVFVDPTKRDQGVAAALMEGILEEFSRDPTIKIAKLEVNVDQLGAKNLYTRFGFAQKGEPYPHLMGDGTSHQIVAMEKTLI